MNESEVSHTGERTSATVAAMLAYLYGQRFGGKQAGRYRISRKFLRQIAGRRRLSDEFLGEVADELFEFGFSLVNIETYFVVLGQRSFSSYRRVTKTAAKQALSVLDSSPLLDVDGGGNHARS